MKPRHPAKLAPLVVSLAVLAPRLALAAERGCVAIAIESDASFRARFPELLRGIRAQLSARADIDACARVVLRVENEADINVAVALPDGRMASRSVARGEDVLPTLQALLLVPEQAPPVLAPAPSLPAHAAKRSMPQREQVSASEHPEPALPSSPAARPRQFGFELSAITGMRIGDGQFGYGAGMLSFLEIHGWLIGFEGRADGYRSISGGDPETALELAILVGRRFDFGRAALDLTAGPAVAMKGIALSQTESESVPVTGEIPAMPPARSEPSSGPVPRLLVGARLGLSPRSVFRTFVGIDGELGPTRTPADPEANVSSPRMPTFTVGLALGATVGTP